MNHFGDDQRELSNGERTREGRGRNDNRRMENGRFRILSWPRNKTSRLRDGMREGDVDDPHPKEPRSYARRKKSERADSTQ